MKSLLKLNPFLSKVFRFFSSPTGEIILAFCGWRLALYIAAYLSGVISDNIANFDQPHPLASLGNLLFRSWLHWDAAWYVSIARDGYFYRGTEEQSSVAFFPLFPVLMRIVSEAIPFVDRADALIIAGMLVANLSFLLCLLLIYRLTKKLFSEHPQSDLIAKSATFSLMLFPSSVFFVSPYSESVFLLMVLLSFYALEKGNWLLAGVFGALAAFGRLSGVTLVLPLAIEFLRRCRKTRKNLWQILYLGIIPLGLIAYMGYLNQHFGEPLAFLRAVSAPHWRQIPRAPWLSYIEEVHSLLTHPNNAYYLEQVSYATLFIVLILLSFRVLPVGYAVYGLIGLLLPFSTNLVSIQRYVLAIFPGFMVLGYLSRYRLIRSALPPLFGMLQGVSVVFWINACWLG